MHELFSTASSREHLLWAAYGMVFRSSFGEAQDPAIASRH